MSCVEISIFKRIRKILGECPDGSVQQSDLDELDEYERAVRDGTMTEDEVGEIYGIPLSGSVERKMSSRWGFSITEDASVDEANKLILALSWRAARTPFPRWDDYQDVYCE